MTKKKMSLGEMGDIRKPERSEPIAEQPKPKAANTGRGRPAAREPYVQLNSRVSITTAERIDELREAHGLTMREVVERAIAAYNGS